MKQMIGDAATFAVGCALQGTEELETLADSVKVTVERDMREEPERFEEKL
jgi:hypothetical protein